MAVKPEPGSSTSGASHWPPGRRTWHSRRARRAFLRASTRSRPRENTPRSLQPSASDAATASSRARRKGPGEVPAEAAALRDPPNPVSLPALPRPARAIPAARVQADRKSPVRGRCTGKARTQVSVRLSKSTHEREKHDEIAGEYFHGAGGAPVPSAHRSRGRGGRASGRNRGEALFPGHARSDAAHRTERLSRLEGSESAALDDRLRQLLRGEHVARGGHGSPDPGAHPQVEEARPPEGSHRHPVQPQGRAADPADASTGRPRSGCAHRVLLQPHGPQPDRQVRL